MYGCNVEDDRIVSVQADLHGRAVTWRRLGDGQVERQEHRFPNWFLATSLELFDHLPIAYLSADAFRAAHGAIAVPPDTLLVVPLEGRQPTLDGLEVMPAAWQRYLVLMQSLADVEPTLLDAYAKQSGERAATLAELQEHLAVWPAEEQFLLLAGRTYYRGLAFADVKRLQFDLETTGLDEHRDRIFMISLSDSTGWQDCLDTGSMSEAELLARFVQIVSERDPDILENHNIFAFDLRFLVRRAGRLGVHLGLGRDGSEPVAVGDVLRYAERAERFTRWRIAGREVTDTLHAVRRHGANARDLSRHGLKDAARYFGFAKKDREYVPGAEIWATFQRDPDRVRRYAGDDVEEVDGLSRRLMPTPFQVASLVPRTYERVATDLSPHSLFELLMVRAYLHEGHALPADAGGTAAERSSSGRKGSPKLYRTGVVPRVLQVAVPALPAQVIAQQQVRSETDTLGAYPWLVWTLLEQYVRVNAAVAEPNSEARQAPDRGAALDALVRGSRAYLTPSSLVPTRFADGRAAREVGKRSAGVMHDLLDALARNGALLVEADGEQILLGVPEGWTDAREAALLAAGQAALPAGLPLLVEARYRAVYASAPRSHILHALDGTVALVGSAFRPYRQERLGEQFVAAVAPYVLAGDPAGARRVYLDTVARLRAHQVPVEDLSVQGVLHKAPADYWRASRPEEPYEVLLASGVKTWRAGQRVRYFRDRSGTKRLLRENDGTLPSDVDAEHYVRRVGEVYCRHFALAYEPADFARVFRAPSPQAGLFDAEDDATLGSVPTSMRVVEG